MGTAVNAPLYYTILESLLSPIQNWCWQFMLALCYFTTTLPSCIAARTKTAEAVLLGGVSPSTYSPDLAPSDYYLLQHLKSFLGDSISPVTTFRSQTADFFDTGVLKLVSRYGTCFSSGGSYVESSGGPSA
ncbi:hypothetical protein AVEN_89908-1 [Araneus ventricosus]|uniref:Uncharacterized protein n=1 Tax=Araneus ventricosus TaxID=182803 RepID=A0A4Y2SMK6_ARAVE|nr:hypothetical protein AVEN_89908-1 [Araneus ventricosus]